MATTTTAKRKKKAGAVATIAAAAKALGVHQRTLKEWLSRGAPGAPGNYDVAAIAAWREENLEPPPVKAEGLTELQKRRLLAQTELDELQLAHKRRELIEVELAKAIISQHAAEVRAHLEQLPEFAATLTKLPRAKFLYQLKTRIHELCSALERGAKELAEREDE